MMYKGSPLLGAAKQKKLDIMFKSLPDAFLQQLLAACESQIDVSPEDDMPWDVLSDLAREALAQRGIFVPVSFVFEEEPPATEDLSEEFSKLAALSAPLSVEPERSDADADIPTEPDLSSEANDESVEDVPDSTRDTLVIAAPLSQQSEHIELLLPVLRPLSEKAVRPRNAMHAFFRPLEALIVDPPKVAERVEGFLCSTHLPAIWRLLIEEEAGVQIRDSWVRFELVADDQAEEILPSITAGMHKAAYKTLRKLIDKSALKPAYQGYLADRLCGQAGMDDMIELEKMLEFSVEIADWNSKLDGYAQLSVTEQQGLYFRLIEDILEAVSVDVGLAKYSLCLVIQRLNNPATAWALHNALWQNAIQRRVPEELRAIIPDILQHHIEDQLAWLEASAEETPLDTSRLEVFQFVERQIRDLLSEVDQGVESPFETLLKQFQTRCVPLFEGFLVQCQASIHEVLPLKRVNLHGAKDILRPDLEWSEGLNDADQRITRALEASRFVADCDSIASALDMAPLLVRSMEPIFEEVRAYSKDLAELVRDARGDLRLTALRHSEHVVQIGRILLGDVNADMIETALRQAAQAA